ncbi:hypothetical protein ACQ4PT_045942 [Festuca glaucescens]
MSSMHAPLHLILLLLAYYCSTQIAANSGNGSTVRCLPDQASSLLQLKHSFDNPNLSSWQSGIDCCHWEGVGCDRTSGQVITLDLSYRNLQSNGGLGPALFNLTSLTNLNLSGNDFNHASLPKFGFEQLKNLLSLDLSWTSLAGQISIGISYLKNLRTLDFAYNDELYFSEPSFQMVLGKLSNLRELYLDFVDISHDGKTWSKYLANSVPRLQHISLFSCGLSGHIHSSFSRLQSLESIILSSNSISGKVPQFFANFSSLRTLDLHDNEFDGEFPTDIFELKKLRSIDLSFNTRFLKFLGLDTVDVTEDSISLISKLHSLQSLMLSGSGSEKPNFSRIANLESLRELNLESFNFSSSIPSWIANLTSLTSLALQGCNFYRRIPTWIGNLGNLSRLNLYSNNLQGKIPKNVFALPGLQEIRLSYNQLSGQIEDIPAPLSSLLSSVELDMNQLTGPIPDSFFQLKQLITLSLGSNRLSGTIELSLFWRIKGLTYLSLSNNMLSVKDEQDDNSLPSLSSIFELGLASCNLTKLPASLRYLDNVAYLDISTNRLNGTIPSWIWQNWKDQLTSLNLSNNMFTVLEKSALLVHMPRLTMLDLSSNRLQGSIPIPIMSDPGCQSRL